MNGLPFRKRNDPFATKTTPVAEEQTKVATPSPVEEYVAPVPQKKVAKPVAQSTADEDREKYTATMEKSLRRRIKIAAAERGIQVSSFIEQACLEKLGREGR